MPSNMGDDARRDPERAAREYAPRGQSAKESSFAIDVNFDSLGEMADFPPGFRDPCFTAVYERIANLVARFGFPLTVDIIAKDLENAENAARVRDWASSGLEIGNHSYSHPVHLGSMSRAAIREEISRAHDLISTVTGIEPRGFTAPNWSMSRRTVEALVDLGYRYDKSLFSSWWLYPLVVRIVVNHFSKPGRIANYFRRGDWLFPLTEPATPYLVERGMKRVHDWREGETILIMPMPITARWRPAVWHTIGFVFGRKHLMAELRRLVDRGVSFYYLMHPADFIDPSEVPRGLSHGFERLDVPLREKLHRVEEVFGFLRSSGYRPMTVADLAERHRIALSGEAPDPTPR
jgi:peptidoglycan/xylan/chitin deacetylase (PgdA/CDA1 family)